MKPGAHVTAGDRAASPNSVSFTAISGGPATTKPCADAVDGARTTSEKSTTGRRERLHQSSDGTPPARSCAPPASSGIHRRPTESYWHGPAFPEQHNNGMLVGASRRGADRRRKGERTVGTYRRHTYRGRRNGRTVCRCGWPPAPLNVVTQQCHPSRVNRIIHTARLDHDRRHPAVVASAASGPVRSIAAVG